MPSPDDKGRSFDDRSVGIHLSLEASERVDIALELEARDPVRDEQGVQARWD